MKSVIELRRGCPYFHVAFFDRGLRIPSIETYIYEGIDEEDENSVLFINAEGFVQKSEDLKEGETHYISFPLDKINGIVDKNHLIEWLNAEHSVKSVATE
ncbi:MAG: hypothetical protein GY706_04885, partial [Bacteroides sp.]|nr:hypothetical protein [Bacteroides sp.]